MATIKLQSSDGEIFDTTVEIVKCSETLKMMIVVLGLEDADEECVPLPEVNAATLRKVLEWATHHKDDPAPIKEEEESMQKSSDGISPWDAEFLRVDPEILHNLIMAANYLEIKPLLNTCCKTVANMIKDRTPEEIRKTFNIKNDFTLEDEARIRRQNEWCEEIAK